MTKCLNCGYPGVACICVSPFIIGTNHSEDPIGPETVKEITSSFQQMTDEYVQDVYKRVGLKLDMPVDDYYMRTDPAILAHLESLLTLVTKLEEKVTNLTAKITKLEENITKLMGEE